MVSHRQRPPRRDSGRGFTLVELLVVLAIMAAVAALLTPMLRIGRASAELRTASNEMLTAMRIARSAAIAHNRTVALVVDPKVNRYAAAQREHALPRSIGIAAANLWPVEGREGLGAVYFFPDGSASGGEIDLISGNVAGAIVVDWFTGLASVHERMVHQ